MSGNGSEMRRIGTAAGDWRTADAVLASQEAQGERLTARFETHNRTMGAHDRLPLLQNERTGRGCRDSRKGECIGPMQEVAAGG